jgi:hypothetical protein
MDPFDAQLRTRISLVVAAAPAAPTPVPERMLAIAHVRRSRVRIVAAVGLGLLLLASLALGSLSRVDYQSQLRAVGVPPDAEIVAVQARGDGTIITVTYRDGQGETHTIGGVERPATPAP